MLGRWDAAGFGGMWRARPRRSSTERWTSRGKNRLMRRQITIKYLRLWPPNNENIRPGSTQNSEKTLFKRITRRETTSSPRPALAGGKQNKTRLNDKNKVYL